MLLLGLCMNVWKVLFGCRLNVCILVVYGFGYYYFFSRLGLVYVCYSVWCGVCNVCVMMRLWVLVGLMWLVDILFFLVMVFDEFDEMIGLCFLLCVLCGELCFGFG